MYFLRPRIAAISMGMGLDLRQRTPKYSVLAITEGIIPVNHKVGVAARQTAFAVIAGIFMPVEIQAPRGTDRLCPDS